MGGCARLGRALGGDEQDWRPGTSSKRGSRFVPSWSRGHELQAGWRSHGRAPAGGARPSGRAESSDRREGPNVKREGRPLLLSSRGGNFRALPTFARLDDA